MAWRSMTALFVLAASTPPGAATPPTLDEVRVSEDGARTRIELAIAGSVEPEVGMLADHRLVVDLPGVQSRLRRSEIPYESDRLHRVRIGRHREPQEKTRVVVDLRGPASYEIERTPGGFTIALGDPSLPLEGSDGAEAAAVAAAEPLPMANAIPPERLAPGGLVSIDFREADLRAVIDLVAAVGGYDVVFAPEVRGKVTVKIVDRPWEEALGTILEETQLRATHQEDWIEIAPADSQGVLPRAVSP